MFARDGVKRKAFFLLLALFLAGAGYLGYLRFRPAPQASGVLVASGTIEAVEVDVAAEVGGKIVSLRAEELETAFPVLAIS